MPATARAILSAVLLAAPAWCAGDDVRFHALHLQRDGATRVTAAVGEFAPEGPVLQTLRPADRRLIGVAHDPRDGVYYGITAHDVGRLDAQGRLVELAPPASLPRLSWTSGIAFDARTRRVLVATHGGEGFLYAYAPDGGDWALLASLQNQDVATMTLDPDSAMLYAVVKPHGRRTHELAALNERGAVLSRQPIEGPRIVEALRPVLQLASAGGGLYLLVSHDRHPRIADGLWRLDPLTGRGEPMPYNRERDLSAGTWPGWPGGPPESPPVTSPASIGVGTAPASLSNYTTPQALTREHPGELHVLSLRHGGLRLGEYLKRVERVRLSGTEKGLSVEITLDPDAAVQPPVVEVVVAGGERPVTLALCAATRLVWNVRSEDGAAVEAVYLFGDANAGSTVVGVDGDRVRQGGRVPHATAWELERGGTAFDEMILAIRKRTGMRESSFQGHPAAQRFTVPVPR